VAYCLKLWVQTAHNNRAAVTTIEKAVEIMFKNKICKLPIVDVNEAVVDHH